MKKVTFDIYLTIVLLGMTIVLSLWWVYLMIGEIIASVSVSYFDVVEYTCFTLIGVALFYGSVIYMLTRYGRLRRVAQTMHASSAELDKFYYSQDLAVLPKLSILIPSYKEELRVVEMTLLSAALQEYAAKNIVLLVG